MGHFYHPPGVYLGRVGQPLDGRKGVNPSILNNPPPPASNPIPRSRGALASMIVAWQPGPPEPLQKGKLNPVFLNNPISQGGGWSSRDAVYQAVFAFAWQPGPPLPKQRGSTNPKLLNKVDNPPRYSTRLLMQQTVQAWQVTWGSPTGSKFPQPRATIPPPAGKRHHLWHIGPSGVRTDIRDVSEVDADAPDT